MAFDCAPSSDVTGVNPTLTPPPNMKITGGTLVTAAGETIPVISATWGTSTDPYVHDIEFQYQPVGLAGASVTTSAPVVNLSWSSSTSLLPNGTYAVMFRPYGLQPGTWSVPITVQVGLIIASNVANVADLTAQQVSANLSGLATQARNLVLSGEALQAYVDAQTHLNSVPVGTAIQNVQQQMVAGDTALAQTLSLVGAVSTDGQSLILNAATVKVDGTTLLSTTLQQLTAASQGNTGSITELNTLMSDINGLTAVSSLAVTVNGQSVGWQVSQNSQGQGSISWVAPAFNFIDASGNNPVTILAYKNGAWYMDAAIYVQSLIAGSVTTNSLTVNAVATPAFASASAGITGNNTAQTALSVTTGLNADGWVYASFTGKQAFSDVNGHNWSFNLRFNGTVVSTTYGTRPGDSVALSGAMKCSASTHPVVDVQWTGDSAITLQDRAMFVTGFQKTT